MDQPLIDANAGRPTVVYVPGLDGTGRLLFRQPKLHEQYRVHCVSYPQDRVHTYHDLTNLVIDAVAPIGKATLLAESFGGAVALMVALRRPELVERLVLVNTFAYFPRRAYIEPLAWIGPFLPDQPSNPVTRPVRGVFFFSPDISAPDRREWWERTADVPMAAFGRRFQLIAGLDLRDRLREIRTPALVLAAPDDHVVPAPAGKLLARRLPNAQLISRRVGHAALIHPQVCIASLLNDERYWPGFNAAATADKPAGSRFA